MVLSLRIAFTEVISGRAPEARGNGLKFVKNVVLDNSFELEFTSGSAVVLISGKTKSIVFQSTENYSRECIAVIKF